MADEPVASPTSDEALAHPVTLVPSELQILPVEGSDALSLLVGAAYPFECTRICLASRAVPIAVVYPLAPGERYVKPMLVSCDCMATWDLKNVSRMSAHVALGAARVQSGNFEPIFLAAYYLARELDVH
ncbi:hypothetical protein AURDEDRAFT_159810 [Auricularia subglabra TFB-10046 SS5]|nr:hypothetical protein AURDEDRAFT_159810 [Auricularia subglabra TFB-10046 SS5]